MADIAFQNATARREAVAAEINSLQQRLESLRSEAKHIDDWLKGYSYFAGHLPAEEIHRDVKPSNISKNPPKEEIADFAYKLIEARGRPVPRSYIMAALENAGYKIEGKDPDMVLSTMLWRMKDKVIRLKKFGYWMADKDFIDGQYFKVIGAEDEKEPPHDDDVQHESELQRFVERELAS